MASTRTKEYFKTSFTWKKSIHLFVSLILATTIVLLYYFLKAKKETNITNLKIAQNITFIFGITFFSYAGLVWIFVMGFGLSLFRGGKNKYKQENELVSKIEAEKRKPNSEEKTIRLRVLNDQLQEVRNARMEKDNKTNGNFILVIVTIIAVVTLIAAGILAAIK